MSPTNLRIGYGYDVHRLETGHEFILGGVKLEHHKGAVGHSDADVLLHAIADALLGAANLRDIGYHFPDTDPAYKGADSQVLLQASYRKVQDKGFSLVNLDCTVCLQKPRIQDLIPQMQECIAHCLGAQMEQVSVKATTTEKLGFVGTEQGVSAHATVLIARA